MKSYEVLYDNLGTVWINGVIAKGGLIARFSRRGIDIHGDGICIDCKTRFTDYSDWRYFVERVKEIYSINVLEYLPKNFDPFTKK